VRAVGALPPARLEQPVLARRVQDAGEQAPGGRVLEQATAKLAQDGEVEARVGQVEGEQVLPVDPAPDRLGRLTVAQALAELKERDQREAPRRVSGLAELGVEVGEARVVEHGTEPIAQQQVRVAPPERGPRDAGGVVGHGRDGLLRAERHGRPPGGNASLHHPARQTR